MRYNNFLISLIISLLFFSCSKSAEELSLELTNKKAVVDQLSSKYPKFKTFLNEEYAEASKAIEKAKAESDEKKKKKILEKGAQTLSNGIMGAIQGLEDAVKNAKSNQASIKVEAPALKVLKLDQTVVEPQSFTKSYEKSSLAILDLKREKTILDQWSSKIGKLKISIKNLKFARNSVNNVERDAGQKLSSEEYTTQIQQSIQSARSVEQSLGDPLSKQYTTIDEAVYQIDKTTKEIEATLSFAKTSVASKIAEKEAKEKALKEAEKVTDATAKVPSSSTKTESAKSEQSEVKKVKCRKCKTMNVATLTNCTKCKAPLKI
ncbi:hypothetical protein [Sediminitomix flava]|uniref:Lipoprotein n=1 Tax=Sediminitomix flava TaxID=379075 RepID=A0A315YVI6_SEDFL|nr:hypothetical protein [Sediminitomix flava]PWJ33673.1 hypothetical protein BC781_11220 [Sediminitomix flava]